MAIVMPLRVESDCGYDEGYILSDGLPMAGTAEHAGRLNAKRRADAAEAELARLRAEREALRNREEA
jgi:hypothetical protein